MAWLFQPTCWEPAISAGNERPAGAGAAALHLAAAPHSEIVRSSMSAANVLMPLAIFDLDNTLIGGDSDYLWTQYLVEHGIVDGAHYATENERFYRQYEAGTMDIHEFLRFQLRPLSQHDPAQLQEWRDRFFAPEDRSHLAAGGRRTARSAPKPGRYAAHCHRDQQLSSRRRSRRGSASNTCSPPNRRDTMAALPAACRATPCYQHGKVSRSAAMAARTPTGLARQLVLQRLPQRSAAARTSDSSGGRGPQSETCASRRCSAAGQSSLCAARIPATDELTREP